MSYREESRYGAPSDVREDRYEDDYDEGDPREYINTVKSVFLAILKLITGLLGLAAMIYLVAGNTNIVGKYIEDAARQFGQTLPTYDLRRLSEMSVETVLTLAVIFSLLLSVVLDGIGSFLLRVTKHGATCVQIAHIVYAVFGIILFVVWCAIVTLGIIGLFVKELQFGVAWIASFIFWQLGFLTILAKSPLLGWILMSSLIILIFMVQAATFTYHLNVAKVMSHVRKELSQDCLLDLNFRNKLSGRCIFLVVIAAIIFTLQVVLVIMNTGTSNMGNVALALLPSFILLALYYLRLFFVRACAKDFDYAHY